MSHGTKHGTSSDMADEVDMAHRTRDAKNMVDMVHGTRQNCTNFCSNFFRRKTQLFCFCMPAEHTGLIYRVDEIYICLKSNFQKCIFEKSISDACRGEGTEIPL